ncbi:MAG: hypothetical protein Q7W16_01295 [Coriobacteriia bacterium]|nr:hypothetical protein [Coriobacteriia bacterium]
MRIPIRMMLVLVALATATVAAGCAPIVTQVENPLVPANTARDTVDKANDAVNGLQDQVDDATAP